MKDKIKAIGIGFFALLVLVEVGLRVIGYFENSKNTLNSKADNRKYRIMTVGNSYTAGNGAPKGKSYPDLLNVLLNEKAPNKYQVINYGRGNANTRYILERLPQWLKETRPQLVFLMVGEPNIWNQYGYAEFLSEKNYKPEVATSMNRYFSWSKTYRLFELFKNRKESWNESGGSPSKTFSGLKNGPGYKKTLGYFWLGYLQTHGGLQPFQLTPEQADEALLALSYIENDGPNSLVSLSQAEIYLLKKNDKDKFFSYVSKAADQLEYFSYDAWVVINKTQALLQDPVDQKRVQELRKKLLMKKPLRPIAEIDEWDKVRDPQLVGKGNKQKRKEFMYDMILMSPGEFFNLLRFIDWFRDDPLSMTAIEYVFRHNPLSMNMNYDRLAEGITYFVPGTRKRYEKIVQRRNELIGIADPTTAPAPMDIEKEWIAYDLFKMISLIQKSGAKVVVQSYPPMRDGSSRPADEVIRKNAPIFAQMKIPFFDVEQSLREKFSAKNGGDHYYSKEFGRFDNHQSAEGNLEIAKLMVDYVR